MRFYNYLNEMDVLDLSNMISDMNDKIEQDCKSYLSLIKGKDPLARGLKTTKDKIGIKQVRKNRVPSGTDYETFKLFNKWLENNGHNRRDQSISTSLDPVKLRRLREFEIITYIFPIGNFSYSFIRADDMNIIDRETGWKGSETLDELFFYHNDITDRGFEHYFFTDEGFNTAYKRDYEIWINCDHYYYVSLDALRIAKMEWDVDKQRFKG